MQEAKRKEEENARKTIVTRNYYRICPCCSGRWVIEDLKRGQDKKKRETQENKKIKIQLIMYCEGRKC
jgi:hypothetical protein